MKFFLFNEWRCLFQLDIPKKAIEKAESLGQCPDVFYAFQLLENTGICIVPGSGFGQKAGTFHFRSVFLFLLWPWSRCTMLWHTCVLLEAYHHSSEFRPVYNCMHCYIFALYINISCSSSCMCQTGGRSFVFFHSMFFVPQITVFSALSDTTCIL